MSDDRHTLAIQLTTELLAADQALRARVGQVLPKGMEISHFSVLNFLAWQGEEASPGQLARKFGVTRGAMSNTLRKLEWAGYIHIRPDWDDARRKQVDISTAGRQARDDALAAVSPMMDDIVDGLGETQARAALPILRAIRLRQN
ncbi:MAG: MarR family transcriptional regulator [Pseudomonadota bacterium]